MPSPAWALLAAPSPFSWALAAELAPGPGLLSGLFAARTRAYSVQSSAVLGLACPSLAPVGLLPRLAGLAACWSLFLMRLDRCPALLVGPPPVRCLAHYLDPPGSLEVQVRPQMWLLSQCMPKQIKYFIFVIPFIPRAIHKYICKIKQKVN